MTADFSWRPQPLPLWLEWTLVSIVGAGLAGLIQGTLFIDPAGGSLPLLGPLLSAPILGILQGLAIRSRLGRGKDWGPSHGDRDGAWHGLGHFVGRGAIAHGGPVTGPAMLVLVRSR
jgi:hypothetical protein